MSLITKGTTKKVRRFVSPEVGTNMYVITDGSHALLIDAHNSSEALSFLKESGIVQCTVLLTHEHPDHTCGLYALQQYCSTQIVCQQLCADAIACPENNRPSLVVAMLSIQDRRNGTNNAQAFLNSYQEHTYKTDTVFAMQYSFEWHGEHFSLRHIPGHSQGSCCIIWGNHTIFTGDSLLHNIPVITRLLGGSTLQYKNVTLPFFSTLNKQLLVLPGHGDIFKIKDC